MVEQIIEIRKRFYFVHICHLAVKIFLPVKLRENFRRVDMVVESGDAKRVARDFIQITVAESNVIIPYRPGEELFAHGVLRFIEKTACDTTVIIFGDLFHRFPGACRPAVLRHPGTPA